MKGFHKLYSTETVFFDSLFYIDEKDFQIDKTRLFFQNSAIDLFKKCADNYDPSLRTNPFSNGEQLMLYACYRSPSSLITQKISIKG